MFFKSYIFQCQQGCNRTMLLHTQRSLWVGNPSEGEGHIVASIHKTYTLKPKDHVRLIRTVNHLVHYDRVRVEFWRNSPHSWSVTANLNHYEEATQAWISRFKAEHYHFSDAVKFDFIDHGICPECFGLLDENTGSCDPCHSIPALDPAFQEWVKELNNE